MTSCIVSLTISAPAPALAGRDAGEALAAIGKGRPLLELRPRYDRIAESDKPERTETSLQHARYSPGNAGPDAAVRKTWLTATWSY